MKKLCIFMAALACAMTAFTGCGTSDEAGSSSEKEISVEESVTDTTGDTTDTTTVTTSAGEVTTAVTGEEATGSETDVTTDTTDTGVTETTDGSSETISVSGTESGVEYDINMDLEGLFNVTEAPKYDVVEADKDAFCGKWECLCAETPELTYDAIMGIPLYAMIHMEINADGTVSMITNEGPEGEVETETATWTHNGSEAEFTSEDGEVVTVYMNSDGNLVVKANESDAEMQNETMWFRPVDEYTEFDYSSVENMFEFDGEIGDDDITEEVVEEVAEAE